MKEKDKNQLQATTLRAIMVTLLTVGIILSAAGFYFAQDWLKELESEVKGQSSATTSTSNNQPSSQQLQDFINSYQASANAANSLIMTSDDYRSQIKKDLNKYASITGISISNFDFDAPANNSSQPIGNVQSKSVSIKVQNPVNFVNLIKFIKLIENNSPKLQPIDLSISRIASSNENVTVEPITIRLYIK